ncbi:MAG: ubiquinol oxidase subunit II [Candidatus Doudnabacteria bacterium]
MKTKTKIAAIILPAVLLFFLLFLLAGHSNWSLLNPKGPIAQQERNLMVVGISLMLIVVVPVFILLFTFAFKYREGNKAKYAPNQRHSTKFQLLLWAIPTVIILILAVINWKSTHQLDPFKPLISNVKPITIQVVSLPWKWLFIYPEQNIATVNFVEFPQTTPVNFQLTSDAAMNSFWIPQLGGQMYAMAGMSTQLHLMASAPGSFAGSAAEISGQGFSGMKFTAKAVTNSDFDSWVKSVQARRTPLGLAEYNKLAAPSSNNPPAFYSSTDKNLYNNIIMKYMMPTQGIQ